jgi:hypothetical protein
MRPHWRSIYAEQVGLIREIFAPKLFDHIAISVLGPQMLDPIFPEAEIEYRSAEFRDFEFPALRLVQRAAENWDGAILYLHTKGASRPDIPKCREWRRYMQWGVIEHGYDCVAAITRGYDCAGVEWHLGQWPRGSSSPKVRECAGFFAGNFWWASAKHIRSLPDPEIIAGSRWDAEAWIGRKADVKYFDLHNTGSCNGDNVGMFKPGFCRDDYSTRDPLPATYQAPH